jgi:putative FmdB family regulatory protein
MPLYDYDCAACGRRFELVHGVHAEPPTVCPLCGSGPIRKAISAPAVHYKGSGWAKKERRATATPSTSKATVDSGSGEGGGSNESGSSDGGSGGSGTGDAGRSDGPSTAPKKATTEAAAAGSTD